jgi:hypothetical protein
MAVPIPDLWRLDEDARRLYSLYFAQMLRNRAYERVVAASRQIRRYAARGPGGEAGLFAFYYEIEALFELKAYHGAWRRLRRYEEAALGRRIDLKRREWPDEELAWFEFHHAPVLYFLGRYRLGSALLHASLDQWFTGKKVRSFDLMHRVFNGDPEPADRCRVTLRHFYGRLGKDLREWSHWDLFVNGFHPRLFRLAEIRRDELMADSRRLDPFFERLMAIRHERTKSTRRSVGERDLTDSEAAVRKRQEAFREEGARFEEQYAPRRRLTEAKLKGLFPELRSIRIS